MSIITTVFFLNESADESSDKPDKKQLKEISEKEYAELMRFGKEDFINYTKKVNAFKRHDDYVAALNEAKSMKSKLNKKLDEIDGMPEFPKKNIIYVSYNALLEKVDDDIWELNFEIKKGSLHKK